MKTRTMMAMAGLLVWTAACGDEAAEPGGQGWVEERCEACGDERVQRLNACQPQPQSWGEQRPPELPAPGLEAGCDRAVYAIDASGDGHNDRQWIFWRDGQTTVFEEHDLDGEHRYRRIARTVDAEGRPARIEAERHYRYGDSVVTQTWEYDAGRLVRYAEDNGIEQTTTGVVQQWQDGRLVERRVQAPGGDHVVQWTWRDGLLDQAVVVGGETDPLVTVDYRYDGEGQPVAITRSVGDIVVAEQSWRWDDDGRLAARSGSYDPGGLLQGYAAEPHDAPAYRVGVDDFEPVLMGGMMVGFASPWDPWRDALPVEHDDCLRPPTAVGHGFPDAEGHYRLGFAVDQAPNGIGFAYGYNGYGFEYGTRSWYGHDGIGTGERLVLWGRGVAVDYTIGYDAEGRMVAEDASVTTAPYGATVTDHRSRTRTFGEAGLAEDTVERSGDTAVDQTSTLVFERDAAGHPLERRRLVDGELAGRQTWSWDGDQLASHEVRVTAGPYQRGEGAEPGEVVLTARYEVDRADLDGDGTTERVLRHYDADGHLTATQSLEPRQGYTAELVSNQCR